MNLNKSILCILLQLGQWNVNLFNVLFFVLRSLCQEKRFGCHRASERYYYVFGQFYSRKWNTNWCKAALNFYFLLFHRFFYKKFIHVSLIWVFLSWKWAELWNVTQNWYVDSRQELIIGTSQNNVLPAQKRSFYENKCIYELLCMLHIHMYACLLCWNIEYQERNKTKRTTQTQATSIDHCLCCIVFDSVVYVCYIFSWSPDVHRIASHIDFDRSFHFFAAAFFFCEKQFCCCLFHVHIKFHYSNHIHQ